MCLVLIVAKIQYYTSSAQDGKSYYDTMANVSITYFTCTLGQAATTLGRSSSNAKTIGTFLTLQAQVQPKVPAVGFPVPSEGQWSYNLFCMLLSSMIRLLADYLRAFEDLERGSVVVAKELSPLLSKDKLGTWTCVGLLCASSPELLFTWLALMKLGISVLLIA